MRAWFSALARPNAYRAGVSCRGLFLLLPLYQLAASCGAQDERDALSSPRVEPAQSRVLAPAPSAPKSIEDRFADSLTEHREEKYFADLEEIQRRGVLRVITRNNSASYFLYRGIEAGFHFELAQLLAKELGVRLEMVVPRASRDVVPYLLDGRGDIIMSGLAVDSPRARRILLTRPYLHTSLVVVTRAQPDAPISSLEDLSSRTLWVRPSSSATRRLRALARKTRLGFHIQAAQETVEVEDLLDLVAEGKAPAAVVEKRLAETELLHRDDLVFSFELPTEPVQAALGVHPDHEALFQVADAFVRKHYRGTLYNIFFRRFHSNQRKTAAIRDERYRADQRGPLSPWDAQFQAAARGIDVDWRLLVSQAYQESRLDPQARSPYGAEGLMQLMPATAKELGVKDPFDPADSISGAAHYMGKLMKRYDDENIALKDQVRFALAAYNIGPGHVRDARALAEKQGWNPNRWFRNVEQALLLLAKPRYYREATLGYCRGSEAVRYVSEIQSRYDAYVQLTSARTP